MKNKIFNLYVLIKRLSQIFYRPPQNKFVFKDVPYFTQRNTGTKSKKLDERWLNNGCGIVCLQMILGFKGKEVPKLYQLGELAKSYDCYHDNPNAVGGMDGLFYKPFIRFIQKAFTLTGRIISPMTIKDIIKESGNKKFVIASVSSEIINPNNKPLKKGGHLILILGFDWDRKILIYNNTGFYKKQSYQEISFSRFARFFGNRGIVIS